MSEYQLRCPSGADTTSVAATSEGLWVNYPASGIPPGGRTSLRFETEAITVGDVLGHPERPLVVWVEEVAEPPRSWHRYQVCTGSLPHLGESIVIHQDTVPLHLAGWWSEGVIAVARSEAASPHPPETILVPLDGRRSEARSHTGGTPAAVSWIDHASDGRIIMTTFGPHPITWREYRGGGAGRVIVYDPENGTHRFLPHTGNAADAVVWSDRVFWIDDFGGVANIWSLALDAGTAASPVRHSSFEGGGVTSLRRAGTHLVIGTLGRAWALLPGEGAETGRWTLLRPDDGVILKHSPLPGLKDSSSQMRPERVVSGPGGQLAVLGGGAVYVDSATAPGWKVAGEDSWIVDADWDASGRILTLEHGVDHCAVVIHEAGQSVQHIVRGESAANADRIAHSGGTTIVSGEAFGVLALSEGSSPTWLDREYAYRRSRTAISAEGSLVAWTQEDDLQGGTLVVHDLSTGEAAMLSKAGTHLWSPIFDAEGALMMLGRRVSTEGGTAAPMEVGRVCRVEPESLMADIRSGLVPVIHRAASPLHELALIGGAAWVRGASGRWAPVQQGDVQGALGEGTALPSSDVPAELVFNGALHILERDGQRRVVSPQAPPSMRPGQTVREAIRLVRRSVSLVGRRREGGSITSPLDSRAWQGEVLDAAERVRTTDELIEVLGAVLGRAGVSHAAVVREQGRIEGQTLAPGLMARAADLLGEKVAYTALRDVSVDGWHTVQGLIRSWRSDMPLVLDLRFNEGGQFADALAGHLTAFLHRSAHATVRGQRRRWLLSGPPATAVLIGECTGSGGEHLAAALRLLPGVSLWGRRTAGAGTGFHRTHPLGSGLRLTLPQYQLTGPGRDEIENYGVNPDVFVAANHTAGIRFDDVLLSRVADHLASTTQAPTHKMEERVNDRSTVAGR